ncbi:MAG TPA: exodeoxyribonuclease V subunit alpha [Spirochaetota bacterium]|nr:exodeoxyribonuclease V subunit alpha [Spirochaetota bacterium]
MTARDDVFSAYDNAFAGLMCRLAGGDGGVLALAARLASNRTAAGDVCLDIVAAAEGGLPEYPPGLLPDNAGRWIEALRKSPVVGAPGDYRPLILDAKGRLYLHRYWKYENILAGAIARMNSRVRNDYDSALLGEGLDRMFGRAAMGAPDLQRLAAAVAVLKSFVVVSGGPGTGKTSTVVRILALLAEQAIASGRRMRAALAAPTGKAAVRLQEAVRGAVDALPCGPAVKQCVPTEALTLHRLLKSLPGTPYFRHNAENPLPYDVVVVDESSMADLPLMAKLADALPADARLILLGDRDQLSSVEAGAVLGDICNTGAEHYFSERFAAGVAGLTGGAPPASRAGVPPVADSIVVLKKSYRFDETGGIGALARAVREGNSGEALRILRSGADGVSLRENVNTETLARVLRESVLEGLTAVASGRRPLEVFPRMSELALLCAVRRGVLGVEGLNDSAERMLRDGGIVDPRQRWYAGRPVMVTRNDYSLGLYNGDIGVILDGAEGLRAWFSSRDGGARSFMPRLLPEHETVYAMTVHKSQGSEFDRVVLVMPEKTSPVLTRELVYTGVTRARRSVEIWSPADVLAPAIETPVRRTSGLRDALWGN